MKNGVDQDASFIYWRLSYRRKFIRTLCLAAVVLTILFALRANGIFIGAYLILALGQAFYTYYRWQQEVANSEEAAVVSRPEQLLEQSGAEPGRTSTEPKMSADRKWGWLIGAFAVCFVAGGAISWRGSYIDYLNNGSPWETLALLAGVSLLSTWILGAGAVASAIAVGSALPAIVLGRVVLDCVQDPTNHNLWPFEIVIALGLGMVTAFPFAALGALLRRAIYRSRA